MKLSKFLILLSVLSILILSCNAISAEDNSTIDNHVLEKSNDFSAIIGSDTVIEDNSDQSLNSTVQNAINNAHSGDTLVLKGNFTNCQFTIDKPLNIVASDKTTLSPNGENDIFYIGASASGSTIKGFTFLNCQNSYGLNINGASNVVVQDCVLNYSNMMIKDSNNVKLSNVIVDNSVYGINISDSFNIDIEESIISNGLNFAISISGNSKNVNIVRNRILNNQKSGIYMTAANNVNVISNLIRDNGNNNSDSGSGIYVNTNITKIAVKGNIFLNNGDHAILYDYRCRNLNFDDDAYKLTDVDNNYFQCHGSMILHHRIYVEHESGNLKYDAENDVYGSVGEGKYFEAKSYVYMKNAIVFNDIPCGFTYYTNKIRWSLDEFNNKLILRQIKNGVYQVSIVDSKGNIAVDFNSFNMTVFLNDYLTVKPQEGNVYRNVSIKNGVGTADFRDDYASFKTSGNVITVAFPGLFDNVERNVYTQLNVADSDIPINPEITLSASKLTTYPLSEEYFSAKLVNSKNQPISGERIIFKVNGKTFVAITDNNGIAKIKLSLSSKKTYTVDITYKGSDDYKASSITSSVVVKTGSKKSKIKASAIKVKRNKKKSFKFWLLAANGKALKSQKVTVKLNGKVYAVKTNKKGIAKVTVKLNKIRKYKVRISFLGNADFRACSKVCTIKVVKK